MIETSSDPVGMSIQEERVAPELLALYLKNKQYLINQIVNKHSKPHA
jgi:hypothetical protein